MDNLTIGFWAERISRVLYSPRCWLDTDTKLDCIYVYINVYYIYIVLYSACVCFFVEVLEVDLKETYMIV